MRCSKSIENFVPKILIVLILHINTLFLSAEVGKFCHLLVPCIDIGSEVVGK